MSEMATRKKSIYNLLDKLTQRKEQRKEERRNEGMGRESLTPAGRGPAATPACTFVLNGFHQDPSCQPLDTRGTG